MSSTKNFDKNISVILLDGENHLLSTVSSTYLNKVVDRFLAGEKNFIVSFDVGNGSVSVRSNIIRAIKNNLEGEYNLYLLFKDGCELNIPIMGEKRAQNLLHTVTKIAQEGLVGGLVFDQDLHKKCFVVTVGHDLEIFGLTKLDKTLEKIDENKVGYKIKWESTP